MTIRLPVWLAVAAAAVAATGCGERGLEPQDGRSVALLVVHGGERHLAGEQVGITVLYNRSSAPPVELADTVLSASASEVRLTIDITTCVADPDREPATSGCPAWARLLLWNAQGAVIDSQEVGPIDLKPDQTASAPSVGFLQAAKLAIQTAPSASAQWSAPLQTQPVIQLQNDRGADVPLAGVAVSARVTMGGGKLGGAVTVLTDAAGRASFTDLALVGAGSQTLEFADGAGSLAPVSATVDVLGQSPQSATTLDATETACAVANGNVYCWGDGTLTGPGAQHRSSPTQITFSGQYASVTVGSAHACAVTTAGQAECWGDGTSGKLGTGNATFRSTPTPVVGGQTWAALTAGVSHTCGITTGGQVFCWGNNVDGQLGTGAAGPDQLVPAPVSGGMSWAMVSTGNRSTCAITIDGAAYCWGRNSEGQLGSPPSAGSAAPIAVAGNQVWKAVASGRSFVSCGLTIDGEVYCWGSGLLGNGPYSVGAPPTLVMQDVAALRGGVGLICAIDATAALHCWGGGWQRGILGDGSIGSSGVPVLTGGGTRWLDVAPGNHHACGQSESGDTYCWGENFRGGLGVGSFAEVLAPASLGPLLWTEISGGVDHGCGVTTAAEIHCWGSGYALGDGVGGSANGPVKVAASWSAATVTAGGYHSCALSTSGQAYCWGNNDVGQLGVTTPATSTPVAVTGTQTWKTIVAGWLNTCGIDAGDQLFCWGSTQWGQVGNGTQGSPEWTPQLVSGGQTWISAAVSFSHACGITTTNRLYCWGDAAALGINATANALTPVEVQPGKLWKTVRTSLYGTTCAIDATDALYCWGGNSTPFLDQPGLQPWSAIGRGINHACGIGSGQLYCWGWDYAGQIGPGAGAPGGFWASPTSPVANVVSLGIGLDFSCVIVQGGTGYCWGENLRGQSGQSTLQYVTTPQPTGLNLNSAQPASPSAPLGSTPASFAHPRLSPPPTECGSQPGPPSPARGPCHLDGPTSRW